MVLLAPVVLWQKTISSTLLSDGEGHSSHSSTSCWLMALRETPSGGWARVSKQTCIPPSQTCLTSVYSWHHTNTYFLTETMQSNTSEIACHLKRFWFSPLLRSGLPSQFSAFNSHASLLPLFRCKVTELAGCVWRRVAERMRRETTKLHKKTHEAKGLNRSHQCPVTGDGTDPDAWEGSPPLTHEENELFPFLLILTNT